MFLPQFKIFLLVLLLLLLVACQPVAISDPVPTPEVWEIQYTPSLSWLGPHFSACIEEQPHASIVVFEAPSSALDPLAVDFAFRWGPPSEVQGYAAVAGWDELEMIVHPDNTLEALSRDEVTEIYAGSILSWSRLHTAESAASGRIHLWGYPTGNDVMDRFMVMSGSTGQGDAVLFLAPDPEAMLQAISEDVSAIGFVPRRWLDERVSSVAITDVEDEELRQPILALSRAEPQGDRRAWLLCLQGRLGEE
jgi:hypothetical protein